LRARELVTNVYLERTVKLRLDDDRQVTGIAYVVDRDHPQYGGAVSVEAAAEIVYRAVGQSGPNPAYVANTAAHLREMGIRDHWLEGVVAAIAVREQAG
jgi:cation transport protein ChaC